jgi:hypothetical protein
MLYLILFIGSVFYRKWRNPEKTLWNSFLNIALNPFKNFKSGPFKNDLTPEIALLEAEKETGLADNGESENVVALYQKLLNAEVQRSLRFSNIGFLICQGELKDTMKRRLQVLHFIKQCPEILLIPVKSPVFIISSPRTGTTLIQRLLSLDPINRSPLLWELLSPAPKTKLNDTNDNSGEEGNVGQYYEKDREERAEYWRNLLKQSKSLGNSTLDHIHEIDADLPEECHLALANEMPIQMSLFYSIYTQFHSFMNIVSGETALNGYKFYKIVLQLLSYQIGDRNGSKRWILKCPIHMFFIKELITIFPDAKFIWYSYCCVTFIFLFLRFSFCFFL